MRVIIAGSRGITNINYIYQAIADSGFEITEVVSGCANGVDKLGEKYAKHFNLPVKHFPANWEKYGKAAGYIRNQEMAKNSEALIAVWDGSSKGTKNMIDIAYKQGLKTFIYKIEPKYI